MRDIYAVSEACQLWVPLNPGRFDRAPYLCEACQRPAVLWNATALLARFLATDASVSDHQDIA
jgi:hypothetical protein